MARYVAVIVVILSACTQSEALPTLPVPGLTVLPALQAREDEPFGCVAHTGDPRELALLDACNALEVPYSIRVYVVDEWEEQANGQLQCSQGRCWVLIRGELTAEQHASLLLDEICHLQLRLRYRVYDYEHVGPWWKPDAVAECAAGKMGE